MVKVVILDDEYLVIEAMRTLIDWKKFNMEIVGTAMDGQTGFDLIVEKEPHVVLTDIRMPMMDGLSIIEKVKYIYPQMQFILFSGYTDFSYAKKAIVLGVLDYIVKPITEEKIEDALKKALEHIQDVRDENAAEVSDNLLKGEAVSQDEWEQVRAPMAIQDIRECMILSCNLSEENRKIREYIDREPNLQRYGVFYTVYPASQVVLCLSSGIHGKEKMADVLQKIVAIWRKDSETCCIGMAYGQIEQMEISRIFSQAREAMSYAVFMGEVKVLDYQELYMSRRMPPDIQKYERCLLDNIEAGQTEKIKDLIKTFETDCKKLHTEPRVIKHFILEFIYNALSLKQKLISDGMEHKAGFLINDEYECPPHEYVEQCRNYQELIQWFEGEMLRIANEVAQRKGDKSRSEIQTVKDYIHTYYQKDLTLFELAEVAKMTPAYFSSVFKAETGVTYIKYLTKVRMKKAQELLREGYKVSDVSRQVGYENYRYFCVIFKKYTGLTAQQFKGVQKEKD